MPDGREVWICNYTEPTTPPEEDDETTISSGTITGTISGNKSLKVGFARTYIANLVGEEGNTIEWSDEFRWNIVGDIEVGLTENGNKVELLVEDEDLVDSTFFLQILNGNSVITQIEITVVGTF